MREVCFLVVHDKILRVYFGSATSIPDERERWEAIWEHRNEITEIVHSHPGGFLDFSHEDLTTMEAVEAGTGRTFAWSIVTKTGFRSRKGGKVQLREDSPWWLNLIRRLSYGSSAPCEDGRIEGQVSRRKRITPERVSPSSPLEERVGERRLVSPSHSPGTTAPAKTKRKRKEPIA